MAAEPAAVCPSVGRAVPLPADAGRVAADPGWLAGKL